MSPAAGGLQDLDDQARILTSEFPQRLVLTQFAFALSLVYLPLWQVAPLAALNALAEVLATILLGTPERRRSRLNYRLALVCVMTMEAAYAAVPGLSWQYDDPYAKAFAAGMVMVTLLHLSSVRSIHLPFAVVGFATVGFIVLASNAFYWWQMGGLGGFAISTLCALGGIGYAYTAMLSNNRLHSAMRTERERARQADAAKARFLAVLSHEVRTPLTALEGLALADRQQDEADPGARRARMDLIAQSARDLAAILDDASDLSAIEEGRFRLSERPVDLPQALRAVLAPFREAAERQGTRVDYVECADLPREVRLDPQRLRQCLSNLLTNALKHAGSAPVQVTAAAVPGGIAVTVADGGPGIAPEDRDAIFEPFRRGRTDAPGMGLGLAISRTLARQMGGDLHLVQAGTRGASFCLTLPCAVLMPSAPAVTPAGDLSAHTVLIVDDIATNRMVAMAQLRGSGIRLLEAGSGLEALEVLAAEPVDLMLLDLNMPGLDGAATLAALRERGGPGAQVPVLALTADATAAGGLPGLGVSGVLVKPVPPGVLAAEVSRQLRGG